MASSKYHLKNKQPLSAFPITEYLYPEFAYPNLLKSLTDEEKKYILKTEEELYKDQFEPFPKQLFDEELETLEKNKIYHSPNGPFAEHYKEWEKANIDIEIFTSKSDHFLLLERHSSNNQFEDSHLVKLLVSHPPVLLKKWGIAKIYFPFSAFKIWCYFNDHYSFYGYLIRYSRENKNKYLIISCESEEENQEIILRSERKLNYLIDQFITGRKLLASQLFPEISNKFEYRRICYGTKSNYLLDKRYRELEIAIYLLQAGLLSNDEFYFWFSRKFRNIGYARRDDGSYLSLTEKEFYLDWINIFGKYLYTFSGGGIKNYLRKYRIVFKRNYEENQVCHSSKPERLIPRSTYFRWKKREHLSQIESLEKFQKRSLKRNLILELKYKRGIKTNSSRRAIKRAEKKYPNKSIYEIKKLLLNGKNKRPIKPKTKTIIRKKKMS